jgi:hypothetical protein
MKWMRDPVREDRLKKMGFSVKFVKGVSVEDIAIEESRANNARLDDPYSEDMVEQYATAMEGGDSFPAIVLLKRPRKALLVLAGNHRLGAAILCDATEVDAYVVESEDLQTVDIFVRTDNRKESLAGQKQDESLHHILYLIDKYSLTQDEAVTMFGVKRKWFIFAKRANDVRVALGSARVKTEGVSTSVLRNMSRLLGNTKVLATTARLVIGKGLTAVQANEVCAEVKRADGERTQLACVRKWEDHYNELAQQTTVARGGAKKPLKKRAMTALSILEKLLNGDGKVKVSLTQLQITEREELAAFKKRWKKVAAQVNKMLREV